MSKKIRRALALLLIVTATCLLTTYPVQAATTVTDNTSCNWYVAKLAAGNGLDGLVTYDGKFYQDYDITVADFNRILTNLYGSKIKVDNTYAAYVVNQQWACATLDNVSKQLGHRVTWSGGEPSANVTRADACEFIYLMIATDVNLTPSCWR